MSKIIKYNEDARNLLERGISIVASCVGITLGPKGRNVVLDKNYGTPLITNDGVTICKEIELENPYEKLGAELVKEVAVKTNDVAGDGTSTSVILTQAIVKEGIKNIAAGANGIFIKKGIDIATNKVIEHLKEMAIPIKESKNIAQIASISANSVEIGNIIAEAMDKVGKDGIITTEDSKTNETTLDVVEGLQFDKGFISPYMVTDQNKQETILEDAQIVLVDGKIDNLQNSLPLLEKIAATGKPTLIIAEDIEGDVLATLVVNKMRGILNVVGVKSPGFGDRRKQQMEDIAIATGGTLITSDLGIKLENVTSDMFGHAKKVIVGKENTTIVEGSGNKEKISERIKQIKNEIEKSTSEYDKSKLTERLAKLTGGVAVIYVGANSEVAQKELKLRMEDALNSTKAAVEEGIVAGGGTALINCIEVLDILNNDYINKEIKTGIDIVKKSLTEPIKIIAKNCGVDGSVIIDNLKKLPIAEGWGYDAVENKFVKMLDAGIVDPVKVTRTALQNASSVAGMILTTDVIVAMKPEKIENNNGQSHDCSNCGGMY